MFFPISPSLFSVGFVKNNKILAGSGKDLQKKRDLYLDGKGLANNRCIASKAGAEPVMTTLLYRYSPLEQYSFFTQKLYYTKFEWMSIVFRMIKGDIGCFQKMGDIFQPGRIHCIQGEQ